MNFDQPKLVRAQLKKLEILPSEDRALLLESSQLLFSGAREIWEAELAVLADKQFVRALAMVPNWGLSILRQRIAMPMNPARYSMGKLRLIDSALVKAHASLCCPICKMRQPAKGLHLHRCRLDLGRALTPLEMARMKAGIAVGARLAKSLAGGGRL